MNSAQAGQYVRNLQNTPSRRRNQQEAYAEALMEGGARRFYGDERGARAREAGADRSAAFANWMAMDPATRPMNATMLAPRQYAGPLTPINTPGGTYSPDAPQGGFNSAAGQQALQGLTNWGAPGNPGGMPNPGGAPNRVTGAPTTPGAPPAPVPPPAPGWNPTMAAGMPERPADAPHIPTPQPVSGPNPGMGDWNTMTPEQHLAYARSLQQVAPRPLNPGLTRSTTPMAAPVAGTPQYTGVVTPGTIAHAMLISGENYNPNDPAWNRRESMIRNYEARHPPGSPIPQPGTSAGNAYAYYIYMRDMANQRPTVGPYVPNPNVPGTNTGGGNVGSIPGQATAPGTTPQVPGNAPATTPSPGTAPATTPGGTATPPGGTAPQAGMPALPAYTPPQLPFADAGYAAQIAANTRRFNDTLNNNWRQFGVLENEYGLGSDVSNPFNRAAMLQRAYQQGQSGTTNNMAAGGQLYSGATESALREGTHTRDRNYDQLSRQYAEAMFGLGSNTLSAQAARAEADAQAYADALLRAPRTDSTVPGAGAPSSGGQGGPPRGQGNIQADPNAVIPRAPGFAQQLQDYINRNPGVVQDIPNYGPDSPKGQPIPGGPQVIPRTSTPPSAREVEVRNALMAHGQNWSERPRLLAELQRLRIARGARPDQVD